MLVLYDDISPFYAWEVRTGNFYLPEGYRVLRIQMKPGQPAYSILVGYGYAPTYDQYDWGNFLITMDTTIDVNYPKAGTYYVRVEARGFGGDQRTTITALSETEFNLGKGFDDIDKKLTENLVNNMKILNDNIVKLSSLTSQGFNTLNESFSQLLFNMGNNISTDIQFQLSQIQNSYNEVGSTVSNSIYSIGYLTYAGLEDISSRIYSEIGTNLHQIENSIYSVSTAIRSGLENIGKTIDVGINSVLGNYYKRLVDALEQLPSKHWAEIRDFFFEKVT